MLLKQKKSLVTNITRSFALSSLLNQINCLFTPIWPIQFWSTLLPARSAFSAQGKKGDRQVCQTNPLFLSKMFAPWTKWESFRIEMLRCAGAGRGFGAGVRFHGVSRSYLRILPHLGRRWFSYLLQGKVDNVNLGRLVGLGWRAGKA